MKPPTSISMRRTRARLLVVAGVALALLVAAGCGDDAGDASADLVDAREQNEVRLDGLLYRVAIFRQLNPRIAPDRSYYDGSPPPEGEGIYAAFVRSAIPTARPRRPRTSSTSRTPSASASTQ